MTHHSDSADHADASFSANEAAEFRQSDTLAARAIVILLLSIFVIGIVLYSIVLATL